MSEESIFIAALQRPTMPERQAFLDEACAGDVALRRRVEKLLDAHEKTLGILDRAVGPGWTQSTEDAGPGGTGGLRAGSVIADRYRLIEEVGVGGMGTVWRAEQTEPVRRVVALKLVRPGMDSRTVLARFEAERQALALMEHPNIARVLDGGTTGDGRPFFVMEYVHGVPITHYCDDARMSIAERLALFLPVCQAVQHAHTKGVIHRDLKPNNILVSFSDGQPVPKVIDFGLAKAIQEPLTEHVLQTAHGTVLGTPLYMSPEQAKLDNLDVDARSDVYALGVLLYELLTGTTPLERGRFHEAALLEMLRVIREEDPPRPSARLGGSDSLPGVAALRQLEPSRLTRIVRGELDWIVMKCLEKDRERRYETPSELARDVERYLAHESVEACPPSAGYRFRKFVRRNRGPMLAASIMFLLLVGGMVGTTWGMVRASEARKAESDRADGEKKANEQAQNRLQLLEKEIDILGSIFDDLNPRDEAKDAKPLRIVLGERLAHAAEMLEGEAIAGPLTVSTLQQRLGVSLLHLGQPHQAIPILEKALKARVSALGPDRDVSIETRGMLAEAYRADGNPGRALPLLEENVKLAKASLGPENPQTLYSMNNLAGYYTQMGRPAQAIPVLEEVFKRQKTTLGEDDPVTLITMNNLANSYREDGNQDLALPLLEENLRLRRNKLGPTHALTIGGMNNLAEGYRSVGRPDLALPIQEETVKLIKDKLGPTHLNTLITMTNLGRIYLAADRPGQAVPVLEDALKLMKANLSPDHPNTLLCMSNLGMAYIDAGTADKAVPLFEEVLKTRKAKLGADERSILSSTRDLAWGYQAVGRVDRAVPLFEEVLTAQKAAMAPDDPLVLSSLSYLAGGYRASNQPERALALYKEAATGIERRRFQHPLAGKTIEALAGTQEQLKQFDDAEAWRRKWIADAKQRFGVDSPAYAGALAGLGSNLAQQKKWAEAEPLLIQGYEGLKAREGQLTPAERRRVGEAGDRIIRLYADWGRPEKAAEWRSKLGGPK